MKLLLFSILTLFVLIGVFFVFFFLPTRKSSPPIQTTNIPSITPVQKGVPSLPAVNNIPILNKNSLIDLLPYTDPVFNVEYLTTSDTFIVTIKESPFKENKQKAIAWLKEKGVSNPDKLRIIYSRYRGVQ